MRQRIENLQRAASRYMRAAGLIQQAIRQAKVSGVDDRDERLNLAADAANEGSAALMAARADG